MKEIILIKNGEIALKGLNRSTFEDVMVKNIKRRISHLGKVKIIKAQSTICIEPLDEFYDVGEAVDLIGKIFGIKALCRACEVEKDLEAIKRMAAVYLSESLSVAKTFKVTAKRSDKKFPFNSPEICREVGGYLLSQYPHLTVDVNQPEVTVTVEVRDFAAYIHADQRRGAGGIPVGTSGKALLLISGGIDSPVAGYMMAKRGIELSAVHFASPPYTSERAKQKVIDLLRQMSYYCGKIKLYVVGFTAIQEQIRDKCPEDLSTIVMRRFMMRMAQRIAIENDLSALITGESVGQVASQTIGALACTDAVVDIPVFRPVIGMDKEEIIEISRKIETFDISIQPYEDCCTVFTPRHPKTKPKKEELSQAESVFDIDLLMDQAMEQVEVLTISY